MDTAARPHITVKLASVQHPGDKAVPASALVIGWSDRPGDSRGPHDDDWVVTDPAVLDMFRRFRDQRFAAHAPSA